MSKIKAKLRNMNMRGETTSTKWGFVTFDQDGLAELEVDEEDLPTLDLLKWLVAEPVTSQEVLEGDSLTPGEANEALLDDSGGEIHEIGFDTSDSESGSDKSKPEHASKKIKNRK